LNISKLQKQLLELVEYETAYKGLFETSINQIFEKNLEKTMSVQRKTEVLVARSTNAKDRNPIA
jgi:hypothetical protein